MAGIGDIVEKIALEGDSEIAEAFHKIGEIGVSTFEKIGEAAESAAGSFGVFNLALAGIGAAIGVATAALIGFAQAQDASIVKNEALAKSFGTTSDGLDAIKETFAEAGVNSQQFGNAVQRMTVSITANWAEIRRDAREGADQLQGSYLNIEQATIGLQKSQDSLAETITHTAQTAIANIFAIRSAMLSLESANNRVATTFANAGLAARGANLSVQQAQLNVDLNGNPGADPGGQRRKQLQEQQDQLALENAQAARRDLIEKQILEDQQNILAAQKAQQEVYNANIKSADDEAHAVTDLKEAVLSVQKARLAESEASNHAYDVQVHNVGSVKDSLLALIETGKQAASTINFADVEIGTLIRSIQAAASAKNGGGQASGDQVLRATADLFHADAEKMISDSQRLAIAQRLVATGMHGVASSGAELVAILNEGSSAFDKHTAKAEETSHAYADNVEAARGFIVASVSLGNTIDKVKDHFASLVSPGLAEFFKQVQESILDANGNLRLFLSGIEAVIDSIQKLIGYVNQFINYIDEVSGKGNGLRAVFLALAIPLAVIGSTFGVWVIAIGLVIEAIGAVYQNFDKIKALVTDVATAIAGPFVKAFEVVEDVATRIFTGIMRGINLVIEGFKTLAGYLGGSSTSTTNTSPSPDVPAHATGGMIRGPGNGTSDSILGRLSNGEYVVRSAAVAHWGENFMHAINNMSLPGFATGGPVVAGVRSSSGSRGSAATINLSIDGNRFDGLLAPPNVADKLTKYAIDRQASSAGVKPSWYK